jgi:hypothetical protein
MLAQLDRTKNSFLRSSMDRHNGCNNCQSYTNKEQEKMQLLLQQLSFANRQLLLSKINSNYAVEFEEKNYY